MSHSFTNLLYHIVFSTKHRYPWLDPELRSQVFPYLGSLIREDGGIALCIGGMPDHVHVLAKLRQDIALSNVVRALKANSSGWIHRNFPICESFAWQTGYGAFTVSQSQVDAVRDYIRNQEEHHKNKQYQDEFRGLLRAHGIAFTEEELWD